MKKILIVTTVEATISGFLVPHIEHLMARGIKVEVATCLHEHSKLAETIPRVTIHHIPFSRSIASYKNIFAMFKLRKLIRRNNYHLIHVHTPIASFITRLVNSHKRTPLVYTAHGFHFNENGNIITNFLFKSAEKIAGKWLNKLIVINDEDVVQGKLIVDPAKVTKVSGIGIDESAFTKENVTINFLTNLKASLNINEKNKIIIHIAEFNENKRQIDIINAAIMLKKWKEDVTFLLVGDGVLKDDIECQVNKENLHDYVKVVGFRTDISQLLAISDVGLNVSLREGLPRSVMEMMAMKLPIIATNIRGNRELVDDCHNGYLIEVKNPQELANRCQLLLQDTSTRKLFGKRGRKMIESKYTLSNVLKEMDKIYEEFGI
jgi:glycosyltransferase involved in cell wall biosynthesis